MAAVVFMRRRGGDAVMNGSSPRALSVAFNRGVCVAAASSDGSSGVSAFVSTENGASPASFFHSKSPAEIVSPGRMMPGATQFSLS